MCHGQAECVTTSGSNRELRSWAAGAAAARGTHAAQEEVVQHVVEVTQGETVVAQAHRTANAAGHAPCSSRVVKHPAAWMLQFLPEVRDLLQDTRPITNTTGIP